MLRHIGDPASASQGRGQAGGKINRAHARRDGDQAEGHRPVQQGAGTFGLESIDDLTGQGNRNLSTDREQLLELILAQPHQHRVADRDQRGRARLVGEQAHLANDLAAADLPYGT